MESLWFVVESLGFVWNSLDLYGINKKCLSNLKNSNGIYKTTSALTLSIDGQSIIGSGIYTTIIKKSFNDNKLSLTKFIL